EPQHLAVGRGHDPVQRVGAGGRRLEVERGQRLGIVRGGGQRAGKPGQQDEGRRAPAPDHRGVGAPRNDLLPSFMWCARPSFSWVKSTSKTCASSLPSHLKPRRNCSLSAPPLSQLASREEVMYTRLPSQLCEIMLTCLPVTFW